MLEPRNCRRPVPIFVAVPAARVSIVHTNEPLLRSAPSGSWAQARQSRVPHGERAAASLARAGRSGACPGARAAIGWSRRHERPDSAAITISSELTRLPRFSERSRSGPMKHSGTTTCETHYPVFENLTWPGRIPYIALSSGTTQGPTKFIPVSWEMVRSNRRAASTMLAWHFGSRPGSKLFHGRILCAGGLDRSRGRRSGVFKET